MGEPSAIDRLAAFARSELGADRDRARSFGRTLVALLLSITVVQYLHVQNGYWIVAFVLVVCSPTAGSSGRQALLGIFASFLGGAAAAILVIGAYDLPWVYVPLQAAGMGVALFLAKATPAGVAALTGGITFALISGTTREIDAAGLILLDWDRFLLSMIGGALGALVQLTFWPDDPLVELRRSLETDLAQVEALLAGRPAALRPGREGHHFELLGNAEVRHPELVRCRAEASLMILDTARLVDSSLGEADRLARHGALGETCAELRRRHEGNVFESPASPPPYPVPWPESLAAGHWLAGRASLKTALSALISLVILDTMQLPPSGALVACMIVGQRMSTGTDFSKALALLAALGGAMGVILLETALASPNVDNFGSFLCVAALALAPTTWAAMAGPRVRNAGQIASLLLAVGLVRSDGPSGELEFPAVFLVSLSIGCLVLTAIDRAVWPVSRDRVMLSRILMLLQAAARLMEDLDPRVVLAPDREPRWSVNSQLRGIVELRGESTLIPGTSSFAHEAQALRTAAEIQRWVVARIAQARSELSGDASAAQTSERRRLWAATLRTQADLIQRDGDLGRVGDVLTGAELAPPRQTT